MIEGMASSILIGYLAPISMFTAAICLLVLRAGASRVFFDIVGTFQASKLIKDADSAATVFESLYLDAITGIQEAGQELGQVFNELTDSVVPIARELAEAQIQLEKFVDEGEDLEQIVLDVKQIGLDFGFAGDQAMEAAAKMAQISGVLGPGSLAVGTEMGMRFGLISGMETEAAMQRMINLQQQTKFMTEGIDENASATERANAIRRNSMEILDELNTIENRSAATMEQITFVMNQFASQAHLANEEIRSMAALSAVMIETGEEQGKGGRALKMMFARLGSDIGGARQEMERFGVAVVDSEGNMRPLSDMLKELEAGFFAQSGAEQQATAQIIAGNRHYTRFLKLMTNLDRLRELEIESAMRLFPAMEEINRRRQTEVFMLEQSEANVRNLSATLGEQLLPAMTEINNKQAVFLEMMIGLGEGPLGGLVTSMLALAKATSVLIGPVVNTIINFKNMSIAFQTHSAITRALAQQQDMVNNGFKMGGAMAMEMSKSFQFQEMAMRGLNRESQIRNNLIRQNLNFFSMTDQQLQTEQIRLEGIIKRTKDLNKRKARQAQIQAVLNERIFRGAQAMQAEENADMAAMSRAKQQAGAMNSLTMAVAGVGSAMMLFSKNQKIVRTGMVLNTAAMAIQIGTMIKKNAQEVINFFTQTENTQATIINTTAKGANAAANTAVAATAGAATAATTTLSASLMRTGLVGVGIVIGGLALTTVLEKIGIFSRGAAEGVEEFNNSMISAVDVLDLMKDPDFTVEASQQIVDEQQAIIDSIMTMQDETEKLSVLDQERLDTAIRLRDLNQAAIDETEDIIGLRNALALSDEQLLNFATVDVNELKRQQGIIEIYTGTVSEGLGEAISSIEDTENALGDYADEFLRVFQETGDMDEARKSLQLYLDTLEEGLSPDPVQDMVDSVAVANDTLTEFLNSREEMFHGFRADNLTGDLVRQVQQQGVETLITNTEVVMTNVFNGMTIPEMADLLIEEIEIRGRANGFNITANTA
tara:strand:- start:10660 stop:13647 length:2988 start_codon:yes stop_codon:yes gene_type:complete